MSMVVCILHYGDPRLTARLHRQLLEAEPDRADDILVLDNAAPQPYPQAWRRLPENLYWAGALVWAVEEFCKAGYTHLWFCNNDACFVSQPPYFSRLNAFWGRLEKQGKVGVVSPALTLNPYYPHMRHKKDVAYALVPFVDGVAPAISLECCREIGGVDCADNPYGYGVDIWLSLRAFRAGWAVVVDHSLVMRHQYHTTAHSVPGYLDRAARAEQAFFLAVWDRIGARNSMTCKNRCENDPADAFAALGWWVSLNTVGSGSSLPSDKEDTFFARGADHVAGQQHVTAPAGCCPKGRGQDGPGELFSYMTPSKKQ